MRKPKKDVPFTFNLTKVQHETLMTLADAQGVSMAQVLRNAITAAATATPAATPAAAAAAPDDPDSDYLQGAMAYYDRKYGSQ